MNENVTLDDIIYVTVHGKTRPKSPGKNSEKRGKVKKKKKVKVKMPL
jgi:hypothetical protein